MCATLLHIQIRKKQAVSKLAEAHASAYFNAPLLPAPVRSSEVLHLPFPLPH